MNVMLTDFCNMKCAYCFAPVHSRSQARPREMSLGNLRIVMRFLKKSSIGTFRMIGGEPTLHSRFEEFYRLISARDFGITIFTNGIFSAAKRKFLRQKRNLNVLLNVNGPREYASRQWEDVNAAMRDLGSKVCLGFNIYKPDPQLDFLLGLIRKHGLQPRLRLGVANPAAGSLNTCFEPGKQKRLAQRIVRFSRECNRRNVALSFDCGFILCAFTESQLGELYCNTGHLPKTACAAPMDIGPDLEIFYCFALALKSRVRLTDFKRSWQVSAYFNRKFDYLRKIGALPACLRCRHLRRQQCSGGCLASVLKTLSRSSS